MFTLSKSRQHQEHLLFIVICRKTITKRLKLLFHTFWIVAASNKYLIVQILSLLKGF